MFFKNKKNNRQENKLLMEIYKELSTPASQEFEKLLNSQNSKIQMIPTCLRSQTKMIAPVGVGGCCLYPASHGFA